MKKNLQQAGMVLLALVLTFSILYLFRNSKHFGISNKGKQNAAFEVLDKSLDILGQRIVDLVQNEDEKKDVAADFSAFRQRVYRQEVAPAELERVIAKVYDLSMETNVMTPEEVKKTLNAPELSQMADSMMLVRAKKNTFYLDSLKSHENHSYTEEFLTDKALLERYSHIAQITVFEHTLRQKSKFGEYPRIIEMDPKSGLRVRLDSMAYQYFLSGSDEKLKALTEKLAMDKLLLIENRLAGYEDILEQNVLLTHDGDSIALKMQTKIEPRDDGHLSPARKSGVRKDSVKWYYDDKSLDEIDKKQK